MTPLLTLALAAPICAGIEPVMYEPVAFPDVWPPAEPCLERGPAGEALDVRARRCLAEVPEDADAIRVLGEHGDPADVPLLERYGMRLHTVEVSEALVAIGTPEAREALLRLACHGLHWQPGVEGLMAQPRAEELDLYLHALDAGSERAWEAIAAVGGARGAAVLAARERPTARPSRDRPVRSVDEVHSVMELRGHVVPEAFERYRTLARHQPAFRSLPDGADEWGPGRRRRWIQFFEDEPRVHPLTWLDGDPSSAELKRLGQHPGLRWALLEALPDLPRKQRHEALSYVVSSDWRHETPPPMVVERARKEGGEGAAGVLAAVGDVDSVRAVLGNDPDAWGSLFRLVVARPDVDPDVVEVLTDDVGERELAPRGQRQAWRVPALRPLVVPEGCFALELFEHGDLELGDDALADAMVACRQALVVPGERGRRVRQLLLDRHRPLLALQVQEMTPDEADALIDGVRWPAGGLGSPTAVTWPHLERWLPSWPTRHPGLSTIAKAFFTVRPDVGTGILRERLDAGDEGVVQLMLQGGDVPRESLAELLDDTTLGERIAYELRRGKGAVAEAHGEAIDRVLAVRWRRNDGPWAVAPLGDAVRSRREPPEVDDRVRRVRGGQWLLWSPGASSAQVSWGREGVWLHPAEAPYIALEVPRGPRDATQASNLPGLAVGPEAAWVAFHFDQGVVSVADGTTGKQRWAVRSDVDRVEGPHIVIDGTGPKEPQDYFSCGNLDPGQVEPVFGGPDGRWVAAEGQVADTDQRIVHMWSTDDGAVLQRFVFDVMVTVLGVRADGRLVVRAGRSLLALSPDAAVAPEVLADDVSRAWVEEGEVWFLDRYRG